MEPKVYIETSIPSFYYEVRSEPDMVSRRQWTRQWWDNFSQDYLLVTSVPVIDELKRGNYPNQRKVLELVNRLTLVGVEPAISEIVEAYIQHKVMSRDPLGDALHLALASYHKCDFLLTWNCRHLANANKFDHIRRVNSILGLYVPWVVTPLEMLGGQESNEG